MQINGLKHSNCRNSTNGCIQLLFYLQHCSHKICNSQQCAKLCKSPEQNYTREKLQVLALKCLNAKQLLLIYPILKSNFFLTRMFGFYQTRGYLEYRRIPTKPSSLDVDNIVYFLPFTRLFIFLSHKTIT